MAADMEWRPIPGYEGIYQISSDGQVFSVPRYKARKKAVTE